MKYFIPYIQPLKMELIECSETSEYCNFNQAPGKVPKEYVHLGIGFFPGIKRPVSDADH